MKYILQLAIIFSFPSLPFAQVNVIEIVNDEKITDTLFSNSKMNVQINELFKTLTITQLPNMVLEEYLEFKIESIQKIKGEIIIKSPVDIEYSEPITISINQDLNYVIFNYDDVQTTYEGKGLNIIISNKIDRDKCKFKD